MEALLLTFDVACMVYLCWRVYKGDPKSREGNLGWFGYREDRGDA